MAKKASLELRLRVLNAVFETPSEHMRDRIKMVAEMRFFDLATNQTFQFTWRTISTWVYRHKKHGITTLENKTRSDKHLYRKVQVNQLAEALCNFPHSNQTKPTISTQLPSHDLTEFMTLMWLARFCSGKFTGMMYAFFCACPSCKSTTLNFARLNNKRVNSISLLVLIVSRHAV